MDAFTRLRLALVGRLDRLEAKGVDVLYGVVTTVSPLSVTLQTGVLVEGIETLVKSLTVNDQVRLISHGGFMAGSRLLVIGAVQNPLVGAGAVKTGTNASGSWQFDPATGLQVCWMRSTRTDVALTNAYGHLFQGSITWPFPRAFTAIPSVSCSEFRWGTSASWGTVSNATETFADLRGIDAYSRAAGTYTLISAVAVGFAA